MILNELKKGRYLSQTDIRDLCSINNGGFPIYNLRQQGHTILDMWCKNENTKKPYVKYYLIADGVNRIF